MEHSQIVDNALKLFSGGNGNPTLKSSFFLFGHGLKLIEIGNIEDLMYLSSARKHFSAIFNNLWNISIIFDRIEWTKNACKNGIIGELQASEYFKVDIVTFHTEVRASLDYMTNIISIFSKQVGQIPESFNKLRNRIDKYENKLDSEITALVKSADWFSEFRTVRDALIHSHGSAFTSLGVKAGVIFQINDHTGASLINKHSLKHGSNMVLFEKYAAYYTACFLNLIESVGDILKKIKPQELTLNQLYIQGQGIQVINNWMKCYKNAYKENNLSG